MCGSRFKIYMVFDSRIRPTKAGTGIPIALHYSEAGGWQLLPHLPIQQTM
jgi:hypothetical protein